MKFEDYDLAVIGAGPAGTAAAITMLKYSGLSTVVIESTDLSNVRPGEIISSSIDSLLDYLSLSRVFNSKSHRPSFGSLISWGDHHLVANESLFNPYGHGWHLDRSIFDRTLAQKVEEVGGTLITKAKIRSCQKVKRGWQLEIISTKKPALGISTRFIIDATGQKASFARSQGAKKYIDDCLLAISCIFRTAKKWNKGFLLIESAKEGWWYNASLPNDLEIIVFITDANVIRKLRLTDVSSFLSLAQKTQYIKDILKLPNPWKSSIRIAPIFSSLLDPVGDEAWCAAGDAASSFDPISSLGIGHAIYSGIHAARVACASIRATKNLLHDYHAGIARTHQEYRRIRKDVYAREKRWLNSLFWGSRLF